LQAAQERQDRSYYGTFDGLHFTQAKKNQFSLP
jgi:hypothetical protein